MFDINTILTDTGFVVPTLDEVKADREADLRGIFGASLPLGNNTLLGGAEAQDAEREALLWQLIGELYSAGDPDSATGPLLEAICAITGTTRAPARASSFTAANANPITLTGTPTTLVTAGSQAKTASTGALFATRTDATIAALLAWAPSTVYSLGDRRTNASRCYICITSGTSDAGAAPAAWAPSTAYSAGDRVTNAGNAYVATASGVSADPPLPSWTTSTAYAIGDTVENGTRSYTCTTAGTSASSGSGPTGVTFGIADGTVTWRYSGAVRAGGPTGVGTAIADGTVTWSLLPAPTGPTSQSGDITDGTAHWRYMGDGTGAVDVDAQSTVNDAIEALSGDLTVIQTPVGGWSGVINLEDVTLGAPVQTDPQLQVSRVDELAGDGTATASAIRAHIEKIEGVTACRVFVNNTDSEVTTDGVTLAPHSIEVLVQGGADQDVADALFAVVGSPAGLQGDYTPQTSLDSEGVAHTILFSRPSPIDIYVRLALTVSDAAPTAGGFPVDGVTQVQNAIAVFGQLQPVGKDAVPRSVAAQAFKVQGVDDADALVFTDAIAAPVPWAGSTAYVATPGARSVVTNDGGRAYICVQGGTSASSGGPGGTGTAISDGGATWWHLGNTIDIDAVQLAVFSVGRVAITTTSADP